MAEISKDSGGIASYFSAQAELCKLYFKAIQTGMDKTHLDVTTRNRSQSVPVDQPSSQFVTNLD